MKNKFILLVCTSLFFFSCKKEMKKNEVKTDSIATAVGDTISTDMHNSQNSLDWQGTYKGILPCADCKGVQSVFEEKGTFTWNESGSIISLKDLKENSNQYKVGENTLTQLDLEGKVILGETASMYVLKK
jgi:uncharacterized lipoprotein NlpE involved in copper resistance